MPRTRSILWSQLKLGIVGVVTIALAIALILAVGGQAGFAWERHPLKVRFDTVGGLMAMAKQPASRSRLPSMSAAWFAPAISGTICVAEAPVSSPSDCTPRRKRFRAA